jgi:hypothetical protein
MGLQESIENVVNVRRKEPLGGTVRPLIKSYKVIRIKINRAYFASLLPSTFL